jgi:cytochrome c-type biogenesis protein CcmH/NrfF
VRALATAAASLAAALAIAFALQPLPATAAMAGIGPHPQPRASLTDIENDVMCVVCKTPLAVSQAPEADRERAFINALIAKGDTKAQILNAMVFQYGPAVLALPPAHGFNLTVYILPPAILLLGAAGLAFALPRWRRRTKATTADVSAAAGPVLDPTESRRLEDELAQYGR